MTEHNVVIDFVIN